MKLAVGFPWSVPYIDSNFTESALNLERPPDCEVKFIRGTGWCSARRHIDVCEKALKWGATHICIIGADQDFPPDMLLKLVGHIRRGIPCVTALVPMRGFNKRQGQKPFQTVGWQLKDGFRPKDGRFNYSDFEHVTRETHGDLVEINAGGTGVLLFPASALAKIPRPWFKETGEGESFHRSQCADTPFITALQAYAGLTIYADTTIDVGHWHNFRIDRTFSERFADWEEGGGDPTICSYTAAPDMSRINQVRVSPAIPFYDERFRKRYGLRDYDRRDEPAFFFGCYTANDVEVIRAHQGPAVVIWAGTDCLNMRKALEDTNTVPFGPNVYHVAISSFIEEDLKSLGITYKSLPLCCVDEEMFLFPSPRHEDKGNYYNILDGRKGIYCFLPKDSQDKYGGEFIDQLRPLLPEFEWIIHEDRTATPEQMRDMYDQCFIGVRPTKHDGLSNTVIEMGLMGRWMLWNGKAPNALPITTPEHAAEIIRAAYRNTENGPSWLRMEEWLKLPDNWRDVAFYVQRPTVSVVIPCYNMGHHVGKAVESALSQTESCEVIVVDDGSTDDSGLIAEQAGAKVIRQENAGVAAARNAGFKAATGDFVLPLDADDYLEPDCIRKMLDRIIATGAHVATSSFRHIDREEPNIVYPPEAVTLDSFRERNPIGVCSLVNRNLVLSLGGYDPSLNSIEDWDLWVRIAKSGGKFAIVDDVLWNYRVTRPALDKAGEARADELKARMECKHPDLFGAGKPYDYREFFERRYSLGASGAGGPLPGSIESELTLSRVRALLKEHKCKTVVEAGCGSCVRWDKLPDGYTGVDVSPKACKHALARFPDNSFWVRDVTRDTLPQADAVLCIDVLQHIKPEDFKKALWEMMNAAGKVVIVKTTVDLTENYYQFLHQWNTDLWAEERIPGVPHSRFFIFDKSKAKVTA